MSSCRRIMVAITGASGAVYARRLLEVLPEAYDKVYLTRSDNAAKIISQELRTDQIVPACYQERIEELDPSDMFAPPASGSHEYEGLVIIPCSMGVVGRIASGISNDLVTRAADVCLKEHRKLVLVFREAPLSLIHLRGLTALAEAGAVVLPAAPAFYHGLETVEALVDFVVDRVLRVLGVEIRLMKGWGGQ